MSTYGRKKTRSSSVTPSQPQPEETDEFLSPTRHSSSVGSLHDENILQSKLDDSILNTDSPSPKRCKRYLKKSEREKLLLESPTRKTPHKGSSAPSEGSIFDFEDKSNKRPNRILRSRAPRSSSSTQSTVDSTTSQSSLLSSPLKKNEILELSSSPKSIVTKAAKSSPSKLKPEAVVASSPLSSPLKSRRKRQIKQVYIPKLKNIDDDFFVEPPKDHQSKWSFKQNTEPSNTNTAQPEDADIIQQVINNDPKEYEDPDLFSLFNGIDEIKTIKKTTMKIDTSNKSKPKEPDIHKEIKKKLKDSLSELNNRGQTSQLSDCETTSVPTPRSTTPDVKRCIESNGSERHYGMNRSYRTGGERLSDEENDNESEPEEGIDSFGDKSKSESNKNLQNLVDLRVSGMNSKYNEELDYYIDLFISSPATISVKRNSLWDLTTKITQEDGFLKHILTIGLPPKFITSILNEGADIATLTSFVFLCYKIFGKPNSNASKSLTNHLNSNQLVLSNFSHILKVLLNDRNIMSPLSNYNLSKIDTLALQDWLKLLEGEDISPCYLTLILFNSLINSTDANTLVTALLDDEMIECLLETFKYYSNTALKKKIDKDAHVLCLRIFEQSSDLFVENKSTIGLLDEILHSIFDIITHIDDYSNSNIASVITLGIVLTTNTNNPESVRSAVYDPGLIPFLFKIVRKSCILIDSGIGSVEEQKLSLFGLGYLINLIEFENCKEYLKDVFVSTNNSSLPKDIRFMIEKMKLEKDTSQMDRIHSVGYFCLVIGKLLIEKVEFHFKFNTKKIVTGLEIFKDCIPDDVGAVSIKTQIVTLLDKLQVYL